MIRRRSRAPFWISAAVLGLLSGGAGAEPRAIEIARDTEDVARRSCWEYAAYLALDAKGAPLITGEKEKRKAACRKDLTAWPLAARAEAGREASRALRVRYQTGNEVVRSWAKDNEVALLEAAQGVSAAIAAELTGLDRRQALLEGKIQPIRRELDAARLAGNEPGHAALVARLEPLEAERAAASADRALLAGYRAQVDSASAMLAGLTKPDGPRRIAEERAARALVSAFDDLLAIGSVSAKKKMDAALGKTWADLHARLSVARVVSRIYPTGREAVVLADLTRLGDAWARAVTLREALSEAERTGSASASDAAFTRLETLLEDSGDLAPEWARIAAADAKAAAVRAKKLGEAMADAEKRFPPKVVDPKLDPARLPGLRDPDTDEVMTLVADFARRTSLRVYEIPSDPLNVRVESEKGKLVKMPRAQFEARVVAIARYAELTAGAGMDEYRKILDGETVPGDQIHDILPRELDANLLADPEVVEWIRRDAAERAEVDSIHAIAYSKGELRKMSELDWRGIRRKWLEYRALCRRAGEDPEPLRFRGYLSDEDRVRVPLEAKAKERAEKREVAAFLVRLEAAGDAGYPATDTVALTAPATATSLERVALEAALTAGDETRAAVLWRKVYGPGGTDPALLKLALDEARFARRASLERDSVLGAGPLPRLEKLPADSALVGREDGSAPSLVEVDPPPAATTEVRPQAMAAASEADGLAPAAEGDWSTAKMAWEEERRSRDAAAIEHEAAVRTIRETTDANRRRHAQTVREQLGIQASSCPEGQIPCQCPESHDFTACHPGTYDDCSAGMIKHAFP